MNPPSLAGLVGTWIALLVLLALTCGSSFIAIGGWNLAVNLAVAVAKALLVVVFMRLTKSAPMVVVVALVAAFDLAILVVLSLPDFALRLG